MSEYKTYVTHLECSETGESDYEAGKPHGMSRAGKPLVVRYDLASMKRDLDKNEIWGRPGGFWKWRECLPEIDDDNIISLGEDDTPLIPCNTLMRELGITGELLLKDESRLPTYSFKARGLALAVSMAKQFGIDHVAMPTNGNAGGALAAYANRGGVRATIFVPEDAPPTMPREMQMLGSDVIRINGMINDGGKLVGEGVEHVGWFDVSTQREPYRIEGKKTMGLELAAQLGWKAPDAIIYSTGGGTGLVGMWKAFEEMREMGWLESDTMPKMIATQSEGCAPIVKAWEAGEDTAGLWDDAYTHAAGIRVPFALGSRLILKAIKDSGGTAVTVTEQEIVDARLELGQKEAIHVCPEGASTLTGYKKLLDSGFLKKTDRVVMFNCGNGLKYDMEDRAPLMDIKSPIDWSQFK